MGINGNISTMSLAEVFQWLQSGRKTGTLHIEGLEGITKDVFFENGFIKSASSSDPQELIGQFMIATRRISEQQLKEALESQKRDHVLLGKILLKKGFLSKDELMALLQTISEEIIYDLFLWKSGNFEFRDGVLPQREMPSLNLDITHIVLEGATREDEWGRIRAVFSNEFTVVRPNIERIALKLPLDSNHARLLRLVDGARNFQELMRLAKVTKYHLFRTMLELYEAGLIEVGDFSKNLIQPTTKRKHDPVKEMLYSVEALLNSGNVDEAEKGIYKLERMTGPNPEVTKLKEQIRDRRVETTAKEMINPDAVPVLKMSLEKLTRMDLSPEQGFLVSRINGVWDVKSIVKISPFGEMVCLKILKKFIDDGVIQLK